MMSERGRRISYEYRHHYEPQGKEETQNELAIAEGMRNIAASIALLTGGCEICKHAEAQFCKIHHHTVHAGDPRCEFFARRFSEDPERAARAQAQAFVNQTLGISKEYLRRVT